MERVVDVIRRIREAWEGYIMSIWDGIVDMDEITFLTATVQRLDDEIARLNKSRAGLLRRLNAIRPISKGLPPETLALVFLHASTSHARCSPLRTGSVCSHWRQIAWSTPSLWTSIDPIPIRRNAQPSDAQLLNLYFSNARALPVSIQIKLDRLSSSPSQASEDILRTIFCENAAQIGTLVCTSKSSLRQRWAMLAPKISHALFSNLKKLEINLRGAPLSRYDQPMFVHAPVLSRVSFVGYQLPQETLGFWEQMTVLELNALPVSQCLETLVKCVRLQEFRCTSPRQAQVHVDVAMHERTPVELGCLTKFEWVGALAEWDVFLYTHVRMPNLRHLVLGNSHPLSRPIEPLVNPPLPPAPPIPPIPIPPPGPTTDPELWRSFFRHVKALDVLECTVFHSAQEWLDIFEIFGSSLRVFKFTAFRDTEETTRLLRALQLTYEPHHDGGEADVDVQMEDVGEGGGREEASNSSSSTRRRRNYLPHLEQLHATLDLIPSNSTKLVLDILCSRRIRPLVIAPPPAPPAPAPVPPAHPRMDEDNRTMASTISNSSTITQSSTVSSSSATSSSFITPMEMDSGGSSSSIPETEKEQEDVNDYLGNPRPDYGYWETHTRINTAIIKCWPFGVEFGERERRVARLLKFGFESGGSPLGEGGEGKGKGRAKGGEDEMVLEVWGQSERVGWL
jgi:hypothetical protein